MKWISVKDQLPYQLRNVLIKTEKCIDVAYLIRYKKVSFETGQSIGNALYRWSLNHLIDDRDGFHAFEDVTHWMPLPELPKDEQSISLDICPWCNLAMDHDSQISFWCHITKNVLSMCMNCFIEMIQWVCEKKKTDRETNK